MPNSVALCQTVYGRRQGVRKSFRGRWSPPLWDADAANPHQYAPPHMLPKLIVLGQTVRMW